jgi:hypothetical protein
MLRISGYGEDAKANSFIHLRTPSNLSKALNLEMDHFQEGDFILDFGADCLTMGNDRIAIGTIPAV